MKRQCGTHPLCRLSRAAGGDGVQLRVDVLVDESVPLAQGVQGAEQRHHLLRQRAAVCGSQGGLRPGPPPPQRGFCRKHAKEGLMTPCSLTQDTGKGESCPPLRNGTSEEQVVSKRPRKPNSFSTRHSMSLALSVLSHDGSTACSKCTAKI